ncbi:hypothetical protein OEV82_02880 [Caldibacillus thermolactis]|jgi:hypothetical protein|uniref:Uncharacterized protein n=1 Tax=Pallidibacillus thermolactis TaxID=251051 RepID=A0ABT2WF12_9BACI|nr:hypothetical protein [Pallidibacillus thermolactis]MCU9593399.1 hypothetical protein [Pallidibacillus thermolactis]MCU9602056.1 hypothetical protein [Pallidibacillus thermolactis subsp. kokeshiiformis]
MGILFQILTFLAIFTLLIGIAQLFNKGMKINSTYMLLNLASILSIILVFVVYFENMNITSYIAPVFLLMASIIGRKRLKKKNPRY